MLSLGVNAYPISKKRWDNRLNNTKLELKVQYTPDISLSHTDKEIEITNAFLFVGKRFN